MVRILDPQSIPTQELLSGMTWDVSANQVEQWILQSSVAGPHQSASMQSLLHYLPATNPSLWFALLMKPQQHDVVIFYALNQLSQQTRDEQIQLRDFLLSNHANTITSSSHAIRNKAASILAACIIYEGGTERWNTIANDLLRCSETNVDLFLQTMVLLMDDFHMISAAADSTQDLPLHGITIPSATRDTASVKDTRRLKDYLKGYYHPQQTPLLQRLFQRMVQIPVSNLSIIAIGRIFRWTTIPNDSAAVQLLLQSVMTPHTSKEALHALNCWCETLFEQNDRIVDPLHLQLLDRLLSVLQASNLLHLDPTNHSVKIAAPDDSETVELVIAMAQICNTIGLRDINNNSALELFFRCWAYDDIDVTIQVIPMARQVIARMNEATDTTLMSYFPRFISILFEQIKYPEDFAFDFTDDEDSEEQVFRSELYGVFETLVQNAPHRTLHYVLTVSSALLLNDAATVAFPIAEATLRLIHHYSDGLRGAVSATVLSNPEFCQLLQQLHCSRISRHYHPEVLLLYYELTLRYHAIFSKLPQALSTVLEGLSGTFGIQHAQPRVRSRCCYLLLRLVKHQVNLLRDFAENAIVGICQLVENQAVELTNDDKLNLFETVGILIGKTKMDGAWQRHHLQAIITPHIRHVEHLLSQRNNPETFVLHASNAIAVIAFLSKGFTRPVVEVQTLFAEILPYSLRVLEAMPQAELIRNKTMILQQRMILMIGKATMATGRQFLRILIACCNSDDVLLVAQLINQYSKFKDEAGMVLDSEIIPFIQRCDSLARSESGVDDNGSKDEYFSHRAVEELRVRKLAYTVLQTIVSHEATAVLVSSGNAPHLQFLLETMCNGAVLAPDALVQRTCLKFFKDLSSQCIDPSYEINDDVKLLVLTYVCQAVAPKAVEMLSSLGPRLNDASAARLIPEISEILVILRSREQPRRILERTDLWSSLRPLLGSTDDAKTISSVLETQLKNKR